MKINTQFIQVMFLVAGCACLYFIFTQKETTTDQGLAGTGTQVLPDNPPVPLVLVIYQDGSESLYKNGGEFLAWESLQPVFAEAHRDIELYVGVITDSSSRKLVHVSLPRRRYRKPEVPDIHGISIFEERTRKLAYRNALLQYTHDSTVFADERQMRKQAFKSQVESRLEQVKVKLSRRSDVVTAFHIADKAFAQSTYDTASRVLLINGDGLDTYGRRITRMKSQARVILCGANALPHTSVDSVITASLESPDAAIRYILKQY